MSSANTRYRVSQYMDKLFGQMGEVTVDYAPAYTNDHLASLHQATGRHTVPLLFGTAWSVLNRCLDLRRRDFDSYDVIIATADLVPWLPFSLEARVYESKPGVVIDLDDARWVTYSKMPGLRDKYRHVLGAARHVIAGNAAIEAYALRYTKRVTVIPTVVDIEKYRPKTDYELRPDGVARIGWIGTPVTSQHLLSHAPGLQALARRRKFELECIGVGRDFRIPGVEVRGIPWSADNEAELLRSFDIGIMPLPGDEFARGKSGLKLIQYLASGLPAVASAVGANCDIVRDGENGLLSHGAGEFSAQLETLLSDRGLRERLGRAGRSSAVEKYSLQSQVRRFAGVIL